MNNVWLSVIVAAYNVEAYIEEALLSVLDQVDEAVELIVVNDGSRDGTLERVEAVKASHRHGKSINVFSQDNRGLSEARNAGLVRAKGEYVAFLDGDDVFLPSYYQKLIKVVKGSDPSPDIIEFNAIRFSTCEKGDYQDLMPFEINVCGNYCTAANENTISRIFSHAYWFTWARIYKRKLFEGLAFPAGRSYEDMVMTPQLYLRASSIAGISDALIGYRMNMGGITKNPSLKDLRDIEAVIDSYIEMSAAEKDPFHKKMLLLVACQGALFYKSISNDMKGYRESLGDISRVVKKVNGYKRGVSLDIPFNTRMLFLSPPLSNLYSYLKRRV